MCSEEQQLSAGSVLRSASGMAMPVIGLGTWQSRGQTLEAALDAALEAGYRLVDTAYRYDNERDIGRVLRRWMDAGQLTRRDVFVTTKLPPQCARPSLVAACLRDQLAALGLDYVDLYLIHHPVGLLPGGGGGGEMEVDPTTDPVATWREMELLVDAGLTRAIGLSNFNDAQIERILAHARIPPAALQTELYLYNQAEAERRLYARRGIAVTSYSSLGSPGALDAVRSGFGEDPLREGAVVGIARRHGRTPAQVLLRHLLQKGVAVIPKSTDPARIRDNLQVFDFRLSQAEMAELDALDRGEAGRRFGIPAWRAHPHYPYPPPPTTIATR